MRYLGKGINQNIRKIHQVKKNWFAVSGWNDFYLTAIANESLMKFNDLDIASEHFENAMGDFYLSFLSQFSLKRTLDRFPPNNNLLGRVSFMGFKYNKAFLKTVVFYVDVDNGGQISISHQSTKNQYCYMGITDHIKLLNEGEILIAMKNDISAFDYIKRMVLFEQSYYPDKISKTVDLLKISITGHTWIARNDSVEPIKDFMAVKKVTK
ncbi:hypothetical protein [Mucilaginibacter sp. UYNi724]